MYANNLTLYKCTNCLNIAIIFAQISVKWKKFGLWLSKCTCVSIKMSLKVAYIHLYLNLHLCSYINVCMYVYV